MPKSQFIRIAIAGFAAFWLDPTTARMVRVVHGGEGPVEPAAEVEVPSSFEGLTEDDLRDLHSRLEERFTTERPDAKSRAQMDVLRGYREAQKRIVEEITGRQAEAAEVATTLSELDEPPVLPDAPDPAADPEDPEKKEADPADPAAPVDPAAPAATPEAIAAGLTAAGIAAGRKPQTPAEQTPTPARTRPRAVMVAAASQTIRPHSSEVTVGDLGQMVDSVKNQIGSTREKVTAYLAAVPAFEDVPDLGVPILSTSNSLERNDELIREAVEAHMGRRAERLGRAAPKAITAAICDPLDIIREIPDYVSQDDPLTAAFPSRPISRLGFQFTPAITLAAVDAGAQSGWSDTDQASVDPTNQSTWKPVYNAVCQSPCSVRATAASAGLLFDVTTEMSNPERIRDIMSKLTALRIRKRTIDLLDLIDDLSINYTKTGAYSAFPDMVAACDTILSRITYGERLNPEDYTLFWEWGFGQALVSDIHGKAQQGDSEYSFKLADAVARTQDVLGVDVVVLRDEVGTPYAALPAVDTPTALTDGPCTWTLRLVHTGAAIYGSTGLIDTGIVSDPQLARQNKRQWFQEEFSLLTKHGSPPWATLALTTVAGGSRASSSTKITCS